MASPGHNAESATEHAQAPDLLDSNAVRAAYRVANADLLSQRIGLGVLIFAVVGGSVLFQEREAYRGQAYVVGSMLAVQAAVCVLALSLSRWRRVRERLPVVGATLVSVLIGTVVAQDIALGLNPEVVAVALISILACVAALFPWGWRAQLGVNVVAVAGFAAAARAAPDVPLGAHVPIGLATVAVATVAGAMLLDRYRYAAFDRAAGLEQVSGANREEAEISAALVDVAHTLGSAVGHDDIFDRVNHLIVDLLGCDWSATLTLDPDRGVYRVVGLHGVSADARAWVRALDLSESDVPLFRELAEGGMVEIEDASTSDLLPESFFERLGVSAALAAPILLGPELVGAVTNGYRDHRGPFGRKHRRITAGIAQATAIAVENQRVLSDLARANRVKSEFVSTMSHELRTPVNVMLGFARVLEEGDAGSLTNEQRGIVARIRRSGLQLGELVDGILDLSKLESAVERMKLDWVDVDSFIGSLDDDLRQGAEQSGLRLEWQNRLPGRRMLIEGPRLRTIVRHLVANGLKFTPRGHVRVEFAQSAASLVVTVSDSGIGIAPEDVESIFDEFHQLDASDSREFGGVGLGLHIVRRLVDRLGGTIAVVSEPDNGSVFTVEIPAQFARARGA